MEKPSNVIQNERAQEATTTPNGASKADGKVTLKRFRDGILRCHI